MEIPTIYCQMGFLDQFIQKTTESFQSLLMNTDEGVDALSACYKLLYGKSDINIDVHPGTLIAHPNPMVKKLIKNPTARIICDESMDSALSDDEFWQKTSTEVFMLDKSEQEAANLEADWGILVLTLETLNKKERFLKPSPPIFVKKDSVNFSWEHLGFTKHYFHTAILVDNYLKDKDNEIKTNIFPLIKEICSGKPCKRDLKLFLVTTSDHLQGIYNKLNKLLSDNNIDVKLSVSKTQTLKNHDRHLITNQLWITSGFGFNLLAFDNRQRKLLAARDTTIFIMPRISNDQLQQFDEFENPHTGTYFSASQEIHKIMMSLIEDSKAPRGTQKWFIGHSF